MFDFFHQIESSKNCSVDVNKQLTDEKSKKVTRAHALSVCTSPTQKSNRMMMRRFNRLKRRKKTISMTRITGTCISIQLNDKMT